MRIIIILIIQFLFVSQIALSQDENSQSDNLPRYPLKTILYYCQSDTFNPIGDQKLIYNENKILIKSISSNFFIDSSQKHIKEFNYNDSGLLISLYSYELTKGIKSKERKRIFNYNLKGQLTSEYYDNSDNSKLENTYDREGQLTNRIISEPGWRLELTYEYDSIGKLIKESKSNGLSISYEYSGNKLVKEIEYNSNKYDHKTQEIIYEYDDSGLVINKKESGQTIERNIYNNGQLIQKWTNDYGIDPCISIPCCMQEMSKFLY